MIPKSSNPNRLKDNFDALTIKLDQTDLDDILALNKGTRVYTDPDNNPSFPY
jgi:diketogulonate reductase-like aldo/keto reductase